MINLNIVNSRILYVFIVYQQKQKEQKQKIHTSNYPTPS